jgi:ParB-like chromosome segregation protein Spo0J
MPAYQIIVDGTNNLRVEGDDNNLLKLAKHIKENGQLYFIGVKEVGSRYVLVYGYRRLMAMTKYIGADIDIACIINPKPWELHVPYMELGRK